MVSTAAVAVVAVLLAVVGAKPQTSGCPVGKFDCRNGKCISGSRWCDGNDNCGNNADELTCRTCLSGSLKCKASNQCIPPGSRCDGITQCLDGSDERGCENITTDISTTVQTEDTSDNASGASNVFLSASVFLTSAIFLFY